MYPRKRYELIFKGAFLIATGTHNGELSDTRVAHRITGRNQLGVAIGRGLGFMTVLLCTWRLS